MATSFETNVEKQKEGEQNSLNSLNLIKTEKLEINGNTQSQSLLIKRRKEEKEKKTFMLPPSSVLSQVKSFLPTLEKANQDLAERVRQESATAVNMEDTSQDDKVIEMNILLTEAPSDSDPSGCEEESDDEGSDSDYCAEVTEENFKIPQKSAAKKNGLIHVVVCDDDNCSNESIVECDDDNCSNESIVECDDDNCSNESIVECDDDNCSKAVT